MGADDSSGLLFLMKGGSFQQSEIANPVSTETRMMPRNMYEGLRQANLCFGLERRTAIFEPDSKSERYHVTISELGTSPP